MSKVKKTVISSMFLALGFVLPFLTGQIQQFGNMLLPMHIPVFLCSFICGWKYASVIGIILPVLRSAVFTMPVMYPNAVSMSLELFAYGFFADFINKHMKQNTLKSLYFSLVCAMLIGRMVWGLSQVFLLGLRGNLFGITAFVSGAFLNAIPGIVIQLAFIPAIVVSVEKTKLFKRDEI